MKRGPIFRVAAAVLIGVAFLVFAIRNNNDVTVDFFGLDENVSLTWLMLTCAAIGLVIGAFLMSRAARRRP